MNYKEWILEEVECDAYMYEDVMLFLIHSILYLRAPLGAKSTVHSLSSVNMLSFAKVQWPQLDKTVLEAIHKGALAFRTIGPGLEKGQLEVLFYKTCPGTFWRAEERVVIERWYIPVVIHDQLSVITSMEVVNGSEAIMQLYTRTTEGLRLVLRERLLAIQRDCYCADHLPPGLSTDKFDFRITSSAHKSKSLLAKLLSSSNITSFLQPS